MRGVLEGDSPTRIVFEGIWVTPPRSLTPVDRIKTVPPGTLLNRSGLRRLRLVALVPGGRLQRNLCPRWCA